MEDLEQLWRTSDEMMSDVQMDCGSRQTKESEMLHPFIGCWLPLISQATATMHCRRGGGGGEAGRGEMHSLIPVSLPVKGGVGEGVSFVKEGRRRGD